MCRELVTPKARLNDIKARMASRRLMNPTEYQAEKKRIAKAAKLRRSRDSVFKYIERARVYMQQMANAQADGRPIRARKTPNTILSFSRTELVKALERHFKPGMSWSNFSKKRANAHGKYWTIELVDTVFEKQPRTLKQAKALFNLANCRPCWRKYEPMI